MLVRMFYWEKLCSPFNREMDPYAGWCPAETVPIIFSCVHAYVVNKMADVMTLKEEQKLALYEFLL